MGAGDELRVRPADEVTAKRPCLGADAVQRINILVDVVEMINHCADHMQRVAEGFPPTDESEEHSDDSVVIITEISLN